MSTRRFNKEQIKILLQNQNVEKCSEKSITYHKEFKISSINKYHEGLSPNTIFREAGFDIDLIGRKTPKRCLQGWRKVFKLKGVGKLSVETRGKGGGRPKTNWSNEKEKIKYLEAENAYLKEENRFLAKLRKKSLN